MQENKNLVEEALIQMKNVEEAIAENAKGILASTMKEEISQLVKESLTEDDEEESEVEVGAEFDEVPATDDDESMDMGLSMDFADDDDSEDDDSEDVDVLDLSDKDISDEELIKVFKSMKPEDGIIVKKDGEDIHLTDNDSDTEYLVKMTEEEESTEITEDLDEKVSDDEVARVIKSIFKEDDSEESDFTDEIDESDYTEEMDEDEVVYEIEFTESDDMDESENIEESEDDDDDEEDDDDDNDGEIDETEEHEGWHMDESYSHKKAKKVETKESKMSVKPKGVGIGKPKFSYKKTSGGFKEDKKEGPKTMGTGKAKFEYKEGENMEGKGKVVKKAETKEAARTLGMGSDFRKGGLPKPRAHSSANLNLEGLETEVSSLREKNEEYRKALNVFREKLNEVAIFNSNLAYATRLFTEHSTTKKEKINILRRFDGVESLKESKSLYRVIKEELSKTETKSLNETVEHKLNQSVQTGSSTTLIESKTYEAPQFLRIKDLMTKIG
jgi:hypothetical protein